MDIGHIHSVVQPSPLLISKLFCCPKRSIASPLPQPGVTSSLLSGSADLPVVDMFYKCDHLVSVPRVGSLHSACLQGSPMHTRVSAHSLFKADVCISV